jgi:hypothetical protein
MTGQPRDDLLGVVGDPARTGKPVAAGLRDGTATLLAVEREIEMLVIPAAEAPNRCRLRPAADGALRCLCDLVSHRRC